MSDWSRRAFVQAAGTGFGAAWLAACGEDVAESQHRADAAVAALAQGTPAPGFELLTAVQAADVEAIAAQIIPTDDLPGAREAGVVHFIDHSLATWAADQRDDLLGGLAVFAETVARRHDGRRFAQLTDRQQLRLLRSIQRDAFFENIRDATVIGMFANPSWGGNRDGAGWRLLGFEPRYVWQPPFGDYDADAARGA